MSELAVEEGQHWMMFSGRCDVCSYTCSTKFHSIQESFVEPVNAFYNVKIETGQSICDCCLLELRRVGQKELEVLNATLPKRPRRPVSSSSDSQSKRTKLSSSTQQQLSESAPHQHSVLSSSDSVTRAREAMKSESGPALKPIVISGTSRYSQEENFVDDDEISTLKVSELQDRLKAFRQVVRGNKADLIHRLKLCQDHVRRGSDLVIHTSRSEPKKPVVQPVGQTNLRNHFLQFTVNELRRMSKDVKVNTRGVKDDLVSRFVDVASRHNMTWEEIMKKWPPKL